MKRWAIRFIGRLTSIINSAIMGKIPGSKEETQMHLIMLLQTGNLEFWERFLLQRF